MLGEHLRDFAATVGTEVEAQHHIPFLYGGQRLTVGAHFHDRLQEFVRDTFLVLLLNSLNQVLRGRADTMHQHVVGHLHPLPTLVAVHGIVAAHH